jgi:hypothetical protein
VRKAIKSTTETGVLLGKNNIIETYTKQNATSKNTKLRTINTCRNKYNAMVPIILNND